MAAATAKTQKPSTRHPDRAAERTMWSPVRRTAVCASVRCNCAMDIRIVRGVTTNTTALLVGEISGFLGDGVEAY